MKQILISRAWATMALLPLLWGPISIADGSLIKNLVVLMMENHSFDHFLGQYNQIDPAIDGSNSSMCNSLDGEEFCVSHDGRFQYVKQEAASWNDIHTKAQARMNRKTLFRTWISRFSMSLMASCLRRLRRPAWVGLWPTM